MTNTLFPSIESMLAPPALSELVGQSINSITQQPLSSQYARSGSRILSVSINNGTGSRYVLKRMSLAWDWLMRSTEDTACRSVSLWEHGILAQLPPELAHGVVACARDGDGWAILMHDVGDMIVPFEQLTEADNSFILNAMAAFHARFWEMDTLDNPALGLCHLHNFYQMFSPRNALAEIDDKNNIPRRVIEGWELVQSELPVDVVQILQELLNDPTPFCQALVRYPFTLVHGDWRHANQAFTPGAGPLYMLDWQLALAAPPSVELARYLITNSPLLPISKETVIENYRRNLTRRLGDHYSDDWWEPQLALGLLGGFLQDAWSVVLKATHWHVGESHRLQWQADVRWWSQRVREGMLWV